MNAQQLEYIRIQLRAALVDDSGGTKGQLEAFAEHPPADKKLNLRKLIHVVELDNGRGGVRRVKAENSALYVMETRSRRRPMPPISDKAFSSCMWRRAALTLSLSQRAWIEYCYGRNLVYDNQIAICECIWQLLMSTNLYHDASSKVKKALPPLTWLAAQVITYEINKREARRLNAIDLAQLAGVSRSTWFETYKPLWDFMLNAFRHLDEDVLVSVSKVIALDK